MATKTACVPRVAGIGRDADHPRAVVLYLEREPSDADIRAIQATLRAQSVASEPVAFDWPDYHAEGMGCGLEDRGITDRYEAMRYGWEEAAERYAEIAQAEPLYLHRPAPALPEGYALVPIEPTEAMRDAGNIYSLNRATLMRIWADMLAAAPQPTEGSTDE